MLTLKRRSSARDAKPEKSEGTTQPEVGDGLASEEAARQLERLLDLSDLAQEHERSRNRAQSLRLVCQPLLKLLSTAGGAGVEDELESFRLAASKEPRGQPDRTQHLAGPPSVSISCTRLLLLLWS